MNPALLRMLPTAVRWIGGTLVAWFSSEAVTQLAQAQVASSASMPQPPTPPTDIGGPDWEAYLQGMRQYNEAMQLYSGQVGSKSAKYGAVAAVIAVAGLGYILATRRKR